MSFLRLERLRFVIIGLVALSLTACGQGSGGANQPTETPSQPVEIPSPTTHLDDPGAPGSATVTGEIITGKAIVDAVEIRMLESFPVQVQVTAKGNLPDGCTTISKVAQQHNGNTFMVTITTLRPKDAMCTTAIVPYEKNIALDVAGLKAGVYTVDVNGVAETFELKSDNVLP